MNGVLRSHGVTLVELLIVLSILGVVALVAIPNLSSGDAKRLDVATAEVVAAVRYARSEAMRSGEIHGIDISPSNQKVKVYRVSLTTDPDVLLTHPVDKKPYEFDFDKIVMMSGVSINDAENPFLFINGYKKKLNFGANGLPGDIDTATGAINPLLAGSVRLDYGAHSRTVRISPTGRVSIE